MKKISFRLMAIAIAAISLVACEDVPAPYDVPGNGSSTEPTGTLPYTSSNLYTGWTLVKVTDDQPWSQGNTYTQATGYQAWGGAESKSNHAVEGWLISPTFVTTGYDKVKISFDQTIRYTNNVSGWEANHKVYASNNYDGTNFDAATWVELGYKPVASPYSDWTLYTSGEIQLPDEMANAENVHIGFWFKAPATASTTWELENFKIEEGEATSTPDNPDTPTGVGTEDEPLTVTEAIAKASGNNAWVKGYIVGYVEGQALDEGAKFSTSADASQTNVLIAASAEETTVANCMPVQLPTGAIRTGLNLKDNPANYKQEVVLYGNIETYFRVPGIKSTSYAKIAGKEIGTKPGSTPDPTPTGEAKGTGTLEDPFNAAAATAEAGKLATGETGTKEYYIKGKISSIKYTFSAQYGTATFNISDDGAAANEFYIYSTLYLGNRSWTDGDTQIAVGDEVIIYGKLCNYNGTLETASKQSYIYSLNGKTEGGGDTPNPNPGTESNMTKEVSGTTVTLTTNGVEAKGASVTVDFNAQGWENNTVPGTVTLEDGATITIAKGDGNNDPKFYSATKGVRVYAKNTITVAGSKPVAKVVMTCDAYSGTDYVGNETLFGNADGNTVTIVNEHTSASGGVQLRVQTLTITYAE